MKTTRFCLVRHGETNWNAERRFQGHTDVDLNQRGIAQAAQMAKAIKAIDLQFDVLYTSDLQRAAKTANAIENLFNTKAIVDSSLRERHLGVFQGVTTEEAPGLILSFGKVISVGMFIKNYVVARVLLSLQSVFKRRLKKFVNNILVKLFCW